MLRNFSYVCPECCFFVSFFFRCCNGHFPYFCFLGFFFFFFSSSSSSSSPPSSSPPSLSPSNFFPSFKWLKTNGKDQGEERERNREEEEEETIGKRERGSVLHCLFYLFYSGNFLMFWILYVTMLCFTK